MRKKGEGRGRVARFDEAGSEWSRGRGRNLRECAVRAPRLHQWGGEAAGLRATANTDEPQAKRPPRRNQMDSSVARLL